MRELWLMEAVRRLRRLFPRVYPVPRVRVSVGWATVRPERTLGQCHAVARSRECQIFISPTLDDPVEVLDVLLHELVHAALGVGAGHDRRFVHLARRVGLTVGPAIVQQAGDPLRARLATIGQSLGPYPHVALRPPRPVAARRPRRRSS